MTVELHNEEATLIAVLRAVVRHVTSLDELLGAVASVLGPRFGLCRVSLRRLPTATAATAVAGAVEIVAVWSRDHTDLAPGLRMPLRSTTLAEVVRTGQAQIGQELDGKDGLLHQVLAAEGIRSYASIPLSGTGGRPLVLSLSSDQPVALTEADLPLLEAIGAVVSASPAVTGQ